MKMSFEIVHFLATDDVELVGFAAGGRRRHCVIYLHGLGSNGYRSKMIPALAAACGRHGMGFFAINTRGHDLVASRRRKRMATNDNGSVHEIFTECVHDINGAMRAMRARGARTFSLVGHSTGANKIAYALQRGVRAQKAAYLAPGDDVGMQRQLHGPKHFRAMQRHAARLRKKDPHRLMPCLNLGYLEISAASFHSLFGERNKMDQFPFSDLTWNSRWKRLAKMRKPSMTILGASDEFLPLPPRAIQYFYKFYLPKHPLMLIPGANHSFSGKEVVMARRVAAFLK